MDWLLCYVILFMGLHAFQLVLVLVCAEGLVDSGRSR